MHITLAPNIDLRRDDTSDFFKKAVSFYLGPLSFNDIEGFVEDYAFF